MSWGAQTNEKPWKGLRPPGKFVESDEQLDKWSRKDRGTQDLDNRVRTTERKVRWSKS